MTLERPYRLLQNFHPTARVALGAKEDVYASDLLRDIQQLASQLPKDADSGSEVVVVCRDRYLFAVAVLATWAVGLQVALPPNLQPELLQSFRARPGVVTMLHDGVAGADDGADVRRLVAASDLPLTGDRSFELTLAPDRPLATVYTSGSTGTHQACPKVARQLIGEAMVLAEHFGVVPGDRLLATVPPHHIYGLLFGTLVPIVAGACFLRETPFHAETVAAAVDRHRVDMLISVPAHLRSLMMLDPGKLAGLRRVFSSGAPLPRRVAEEMSTHHKLGVTEVYGSSETGGIAWRIQRGEDTPWAPLPGVRVERDTDGCLRVESPFLPPGQPQPTRCQDRIELVDRDRFVLRGRIDNVVKIGGKRIALAELEQRLLGLPAVADAAVAAIEVGGARGQQIVAVAVPSQAGVDAPTWVREIKRALLQWFDPVVLPRQVRVVPSLPREANGKLTRHRLL
ncbi:MAG: class I adenylate-forming enzyme family protein, partial [Nannocystaceae bacterium]